MKRKGNPFSIQADHNIDGQLPINMYIELDINFLGLKVPNVDFNYILYKEHQSKMPGIVDYNLIRSSLHKPLDTGTKGKVVSVV